MKRKLIHDLSANSLQLIINQVCGLAVFYILSTRLSKDSFGEINWSLALLMTGFGILSLGMDQLFVRRIAAGAAPSSLLSVYLVHVLGSGLLAYGLVFVAGFVFPGFFSQHNLLLALGLAKLMIFFSTPFKQLATGLEKFRALLLMSVCSNLVRTLALACLVIWQQYDLRYVIGIFILGDLTELLLSIYITRTRLQVPVRLIFQRDLYRHLLKESMPQFGVTVMSVILARFDWIYLGLFTSSLLVAEYSFAYKVFEVATLPMLVIAPILIPRFTKLFHPGRSGQTPDNVQELFLLLRLEMLIASFSGLVLCICWTPVIDRITQHKYGAVNQLTITLLAAAIPFLYFNNFMWTINFARGHLKSIFKIFVVTLLVNVMADILLIPLWGAEGAAAGFLLSMAVQSTAYYFITLLKGLPQAALSLPILMLAAFIAGVLAFYLGSTTWLQLGIALPLFAILVILSAQFKAADISRLKRFASWRGNP